MASLYRQFRIALDNWPEICDKPGLVRMAEQKLQVHGIWPEPIKAKQGWKAGIRILDNNAFDLKPRDAYPIVQRSFLDPREATKHSVREGLCLAVAELGKSKEEFKKE